MIEEVECIWCRGRFTHLALLQNVDVWVCDVCAARWKRSPMYALDGVISRQD